jgi:hypothetical protein
MDRTGFDHLEIHVGKPTEGHLFHVRDLNASVNDTAPVLAGVHFTLFLIPYCANFPHKSKVYYAAVSICVLHMILCKAVTAWLM